VDRLVEKLKEKGLVDDQVFAKAWMEARRSSKKKGVNAIKAELYQKGIAREIIEETLEWLRVKGEGGSEEQLAREALEKKMRVWRNLPELEFKKKALEFLVRRGFEYEVAKEVVTQVLSAT
jgi:regulatory protein